MTGRGARINWTLWGSRGQVSIVRHSDVRADEHPIHPYPDLSRQLDDWVANPATRRTLTEIAQLIGRPYGGQIGHDRDLEIQLKRELESAFRRQELAILPFEQEFTIVDQRRGRDESPPPAPPPPSTERRKTWIEIELVDESGRPVPDERFAMELTDGSRKEGRLDGSGRARVDGIDPGTCEVWFPDRDASEWRLA